MLNIYLGRKWTISHASNILNEGKKHLLESVTLYEADLSKNRALQRERIESLTVLWILSFNTVDKKTTVALIKDALKSLKVMNKMIHNIGFNAFWPNGLLHHLKFCSRKSTFVLVGLFLSFFLFADACSAQKYLSLRSERKAERINFKVGDEISIRIDGEKTVFQGEITALRDSSIVFNKTELKLSRIDEIIDFSRGSALRAAGKSLWVAVPITFLFNGLNRWINTKESPVIDEPTLELAAVFAGTGTALMLVPHKRYKTKKKWRLLIIDTTFYPSN